MAETGVEEDAQFHLGNFNQQEAQVVYRVLRIAWLLSIVTSAWVDG